MPGFEWFGSEERKQVQDVLDTGVLFRYGFDQARQGHWKAKTFETRLAARLGLAHCHLCSSGTAALSVALAACGVGAGDEVIVPPFTFIATVEAVLTAGAVPVFADIDETLCLNPDALEAALTQRTKAVLPVHMCGAAARIDEIKSFCDAKGLILIEDACQSLGATYDGKSVGTFGRIGCFSFDPVKTVTCGEGGAVVTDLSELYEAAAAFADHGHDHIGNDRGLEGHPMLGYNFRISELNAAVGLAQLEKLDRIVQRQRRNKAILKDALKDLPDVRFRSLPDESGDSATFLSFFAPNQERARALIKDFAAAGIDSCFFWYDNNWHYLRNWHHFKNLHSPARLPLTLLERSPDYAGVAVAASDEVMRRSISMLIKLSWSEAELEERATKMRKILK